MRVRRRRRAGWLGRLLRRPYRFRQVQRELRREGSMRLPVSFYGKGDILEKDVWRGYLKKYNPRDLMESMDKLYQKGILGQAGIPIPETLMTVGAEEELISFQDWLATRGEGFVIKPSQGHGGTGILVIERIVARKFILTSGKGVDASYLIRHAMRIINGRYLGGTPDTAMIEERIILSRRLRELATMGLLDIRVVIFKGFPIMAMTRLPTKGSGGKANVHQGAFAAGISISEGRIISGTIGRKSSRKHPGTGRSLVGFGFNMWEEIMETASAASDAMGMGFAGVDLAVDDRRGVLVIEVNRRPGLEIQNANRAGLRRRIRFVERRIRKEKMDISAIGPGIKAELSRNWDKIGWGAPGGDEEEE